MLVHPSFDPIAFTIGPLAVRWYGLMYGLGFLAGWLLGRYRAARSGWEEREVDDLIFYCALGLIIGGRVGYVLFYGLERALDDPLYPLRIWEGGMSFHGGLLGALAGAALLGRRYGRGFVAVLDYLAPLVPIGLGLGRIGNFINGELYGRVTELPWGMVFASPGAGSLPRHPSQLYQAATEGLLLFAILWWFSARARPRGAVAGLFLLGYGLFRFLTEFAREPDAHIGFVAFGWMTMGQALSLPMILAGAAVLAWSYRRRRGDGDAPVP